MSSISNTQSNRALDMLSRQLNDVQRPLPKDKHTISTASTHGVSVNPNANTPESIQTPQEKARMAAEGLVSTTFIEPILKQMRESNNTPPPFGPSRAEKQFASLLDTKLSDEIVKASNFPLIQRITDELLRNMPVAKAPEQQLDTQG